MSQLKLNPATALTIKPNKETVITHKGQTYKITSIQTEKVGGTQFHRYKTQQGEEFLHIPSQGRLAPPYEAPWYAFPSNTEVYLQEEYKRPLIEEAIVIAGGETKLRRILAAQGTTFSCTHLYKHLHGLRDGMRINKLISILTYMERDLDEVSCKIMAIGHCRAIQRPNLPFRLDNVHGARILAARFSDGTNCVPKGRGPRFDYSNNDSEQRARIMESLQRVFGVPNLFNRERDYRQVAQVRTSTDIIGHTLRRAGALPGEIVDQNPHIPVWIQGGSIEIKREWLVQAYGDEGYVWPNRGKVCMGRKVESSSILSEDMIPRIEQIGWAEKAIGERPICDVAPSRDLPTNIYEIIESHPPNLLLEEKRMLRVFGIEAKMYPLEMHRGKYGNYSAHWVVQTETREDSRRFLEQVGFPQKRKRAELLSTLRLESRRGRQTMGKQRKSSTDSHRVESHDYKATIKR